MSRRLALYLMAAGTVTLWGASFPLTKAILAWLGPTMIAFLRWCISAAFLFGWLIVADRPLTRSANPRRGQWLAGRPGLAAAVQLLRRDGKTVVWVAFTGITLFYFLENLSLRYTTATNAGVLANLTSVFIVLVSAVWLAERLGAAEWLAVGVAFLGAVLISLGAGHLTVSGPGLGGDALMVVASFFAAVYSVGGKGLVARYPAPVVTAVVAAVGALFLLPLAILEGSTLAAPAEAWGGLLLLGIGSGALANLWWLSVLSRTTASRAGMSLFLIPVVSTAIAVVFLHEPLTLTMLIGALLVLGGVAVAERHEQGARRHVRDTDPGPG